MKTAAALLCLLILPIATTANGLKSRAERSNYTETSRYADVIEFINELQKLNPSVKVESFATTNEGRELPLVILSRPAVSSPREAFQSGKPVVFILANIHAGEVEGKEAAQHLMRDVAAGPLAALLDKIILLVAPIYNADGNERIDINNRSAQNGPAGGVGVRENAQRLDLNRDFMKLESPEARGLIEAFNRWDPHVVMDLHTTNGSYHGYHLTYAPPLNPNTDARITSFARERLLPAVTRALKTKHNYRVYYYGNFVDPQRPTNELGGDRQGTPRAWATFDHRPRFGTNYIGLRNRLAILSEAYSYLDFRARVDVTDKFVRSILQYVADHAAEVVSMIREADLRSATTGLTAGNEEGFAVSSELKSAAKPVDILVGSVTRTIDPRNNRARLEATSEARPVKMAEWGEFRAARRVSPPAAYILRPDQKQAIENLLAHGITVEVTRQEEAFDVERYTVRSVTRAQRPFQGHREAKFEVVKSDGREKFPAGSFVVSMRQPRAPLAFYLLEPESDDGLANWNFFDEEIDRVMKENSSAVFPVFRLKAQPAVPREVRK
ncbi:MAG: M14 family metallopeptidase [Acidobacteriota bacterium]